MLKDVIITMQTIQNCDDAEEASTLDFSTDGLYTFDESVGCLTYEETEVTGMEGTRTTVFVMPDKVVVDRDGSVTSRMEFKPGEKTSFLYNTPFGNATMGISTRTLNQSFGAHGGRAEIEYVIDVEHRVFTKNKFIINVEQAGGRTNA